MNDRVQENRVWIGLLHVAPEHGCEVLDAGKNAFTNVVGQAPTPAEFEAAVAGACRALCLEMQSLAEVQEYAKKFSGLSIPPEIAEARRELDTGQGVAFATFFTYQLD